MRLATIRSLAVAVATLATLGSAGCLTDAVAPLPPALDALRTRTSLPSLHVTGVAEYNATITVTGGTTEATTTADPRTGRFAVDVPLADGDNALKVLASDAADNTSDATELTVVREPPRAEVVHVALPRTTVSADDGTLEVVVDVNNDEPEIALDTLGVTLSIPEDATFAPLPVVVNDTGHAVVVLDERRAQGTFTLRVQADVADLDGNKAFDQAGFTVVPGRPETVDVALSATVDGTAIAPANAITVPAATTVNVDVVVTDAHDNVIPDTQISIDAPGAGGTILGDRIVDLIHAGTFDVVADTGIALVAGTATLTVTAAAADHVELALSADRVAAGTAVTATSRVVDTYGNTVTTTAPALSTTAPQDFAAPLVDDGVAAAVATVTTAGSYTVTATDPASLATPASLALTVVPGAPVDPDFIALAAGPHKAGDDVIVTYALKDAFGNVNTTFPVTVTTSAPNAFIDDDGRGTITISDITVAGTYTVRGRAAGTGLEDDVETLIVTATDADHVVLATSDALVQAGTAVRAVARVVDRFDNVVTETAPDVVIDAPQSFGAPLVDGGVATANVTVTTAGTYTITASDPASGATPASEPLQVVAATAVNGDFIEVDATGLPYHAGAPVRVTYNFVDAFGNDNTSTPLVVTVNAPNVTVVDNGAGVVEINGIVRAGSYVIRGHAVGTGLPDDLETLVIDPNPQLAGFNLVLSAALTAEFGTVVFNGTDGFGNLIDQANITTTFSDASVTRNGSELTFGRPGSFSVTACITGTTLCDTEFISVQGLLDTVPPEVTIALQSPTPGSFVARQQRVVFGVSLQDDRALSSVSFVATFGENGNCRTSGGPILFSGATQKDVTFSFTVQTCAIPSDVVHIVVQASDQTGNTRNAEEASLSVTNPFVLTFPNVASTGAFATEIVAFQGSLNTPTGVAVQKISGAYFVTEPGNDRTIGIATDRVQFDVRDQQGNRFFLSNVRGAASSAAGNLFFGVDDARGNNQTAGLIRIRTDLVSEIFVDNNTPGGQSEAIGQQQLVTQVVVSEPAAATTAPSVVCMTINAQDHIYCYGNIDATPIGAQRLAEVEVGNALRPRAIAIDGPDALGDADVLFAALDGNTHVIRPFTFNAARTTLTAGADISIATVVDANGNAASGVTNSGALGDLVVGPQPAENLYLVDRSRGRILKIDRSTPTPTVRVFATGFTSPTGLAFDFDRNALVVTDDQDRVVYRIAPDATAATPGTF